MERMNEVLMVNVFYNLLDLSAKPWKRSNITSAIRSWTLSRGAYYEARTWWTVHLEVWIPTRKQEAESTSFTIIILRLSFPVSGLTQTATTLSMKASLLTKTPVKKQVGPLEAKAKLRTQQSLHPGPLSWNKRPSPLWMRSSRTSKRKLLR